MRTLQELINFRGKSAIITGAANGIGQAIAYRLAEAGADLYLVDKDEKGLSATRALVTAFPGKVDTVVIDLSDQLAIDSFWDNIDGSQIDALVNNVGIFPFKKFIELDHQFLNKVMEVNLYSVIWMCQHMIKCRYKRGGAIVNIGSIEALLPFKTDMLPYSLSKNGVITITRDLAREFGKKGFRINAVLPGGIISKGTKTAATKAIFPPKPGLISDGYNFLQRLPAGRLGLPDEIARVVLMLCSELASYIYGALIPVDGGFLSA